MTFAREFEGSFSRFDGETLTVGNEFFERTWTLTENGPVSAGLVNRLNSFEIDIDVPITDWQLPDGREPELGRFAGITSEKVDADSFTSACLRVGARWEFSGLSIRWDIKIFPHAPGLWTRLHALGSTTNAEAKESSEARAAIMPIVGTCQRAFGYFNDTQNRNKDVTDILREEPVGPEEGPKWASAFVNQVSDGGWMCVKESHKCPNQDGYDTGAFLKISREGEWTGLATTGWGLQPEDIRSWQLRGGWANWFVVFGGSLSDQDALKSFDRARYPFDASRDCYIMANTWGSNRSRAAAHFESIREEIDVASEIGIDVVQIDDGWQTGNGENTWVGPVRWQPDQEVRFPGGWTDIKVYANKMGVALGLWAAWVIPDEELIENLTGGNFKYFKIDFAILDNCDKIEELVRKARHLTDASGGAIRINWDVTENPPRVGYYFGREFGNIYLENRKPDFPQRVVYTPRLVLRDAWQLSRWLPLNKFQITYQNVDMVDPAFSNAREYPHDYCFAITLMASPICFQELKYLSDDAKTLLKPLIRVYKEVREEILTGRVSPIGDKPTDHSITGFQCETGTNAGYVLIFRELHNDTPIAELELNNISVGELKLINLMTRASENAAMTDGKM